jgi:pSer/pThr/pTyr-binding forkhead associated (FHA) protein
LGGVALITCAVFLILHVVKKLKNRPPKQKVQSNTAIMTGVKTQFDDETAFISFCNADNNTQVWKAYLNEPVLMGRDEHCIIQLESTTVSREHCLITYQHGNVEIVNKSKTSIAKLNDRPLDRSSILKVGDRVKCGSMTLYVSEIFLPRASMGSLKETSIIDV